MSWKSRIGQLVKDEDGAILSAEAVLWATVMVIGLLVGFAMVRFAVVEMFDEQFVALANRESYEFGGPGAASIGGVPLDTSVLTTGEVPSPGTDSGGVTPSPAEPESPSS